MQFELSDRNMILEYGRLVVKMNKILEEDPIDKNTFIKNFLEILDLCGAEKIY